MPFEYALFFGFIAALHVQKIIKIWLEVFNVLRRVDKKIWYVVVPVIWVIITIFLTYTSETVAIVAFIIYVVITVVSNYVNDSRKRRR